MLSLNLASLMKAIIIAWMSGCRKQHITEGIIAQGGDDFQPDVAGALDGSLVVLLEADRADGAGGHGPVGEAARCR